MLELHLLQCPRELLAIADEPKLTRASQFQRFAELAIPAVGLWARVPHYAAAMPYPEASAVLLEGLTSTAGIARIAL